MLASCCSLLLASCNEFSKDEEEVIKSGRLRNEAIAVEFYDDFNNYWNNTINEELEKTREDIYNEKRQLNMFFGGTIFETLADSYIEKTEQIAEEFNNSYQKTTELLKSQIGENGLTATIKSLDTTLKYIEEGYTLDGRIYGEEESLSEKLVNIMGHKLIPADSLINNNYNLENIAWNIYYKADIKSESNDNCMYIVLKMMQNWLKNKQEKDVSVVYCEAYENSKNSYIVGYSNHRSFLITFLRNKKDICSFEWKEMVYETSYVGKSLLD